MDSLAAIVGPLLEWYGRNARSLPWREEPAPYRVWVSEIMLQQTRVEAVKPYFARFLTELPDVPALASAPEQQLMKLWEGLGYYSRARNLQKAARVMVEQYGGTLPADYDALLKLPGIGPYTAGAVASIAYGIPVPAVDGNVLRVVMRLTAGWEDIADPAVKRAVERRMAAILPKDRPGDFNQAMMELGATVCAPERTVFLLVCDGELAIRKRADSGLLAGLWELPSVEGKLNPEGAAETLQEWGAQPVSIREMPAAKHIFSHVEWHMTGYWVDLTERPEGFTWAGREMLQQEYALPSAFRAYLEAFTK